MKITLDTNFLISATQWVDSVSYKLLRRLIENNVSIFVSKEILSELADVLARDFNRDITYIEKLISSLINMIKTVEPIEKVNVIIEDPDDNKIIECALASQSDFIITYDNHLLKLKKYRGISIVTPEVAFGYL